MQKKTITERRKTIRKEICMPIDFVVTEGITIVGEILDVNCYGLKFQFLFHAIDEMDLVDKSLSCENMTLKIDNFGKETHIQTLVSARWSAYKYAIRKRIYEVGLTLQFDESQKQKWNHFYENV